MSRHFRLEPVLEQRKFIEEQAHREFLDAVEGVRRARRELERLRVEASDCRRTLRRVQEQSRQAWEIVLHLRFLERMEGDAARQRRVVDDLVAIREEKRRVLVGAVKDRKAIERLKERQLAAGLRLEKARERKRLDDLAVTRYAGERSLDGGDRSGPSETGMATGKSFQGRKTFPSRTPPRGNGTPTTA
jgi:flagellar FliJ protein